jgi:hypothetical protein
MRHNRSKLLSEGGQAFCFQRLQMLSILSSGEVSGSKEKFGFHFVNFLCFVHNKKDGIVDSNLLLVSELQQRT